jgi:hypothetical protein
LDYYGNTAGFQAEVWLRRLLHRNLNPEVTIV